MKDIYVNKNNRNEDAGVSRRHNCLLQLTEQKFMSVKTIGKMNISLTEWPIVMMFGYIRKIYLAHTLSFVPVTHRNKLYLKQHNWRLITAKQNIQHPCLSIIQT